MVDRSRSGSGRNQRGEVRFSPLFNDAFLKIFGSADSAPVTRPLVNAVLRAAGLPEIGAVECISADSALPGGIECKTPRLDVVVSVDGGRRIVDLEAQRREVDIGAKSLFYAAKLLVERTPKGQSDNYGEMPQVVSVVLLEGSVLFPDKRQYVNVCGLNWANSVGGGLFEAGPGNVHIVVAELDKVGKLYNMHNMEDVLADETLAWLYVLAKGYDEPGVMDMLAEAFPEMAEFAKRYNIAIGDPDLKRMYDAWWQSHMEYNSAIDFAEKKGVRRGVEQGIEKGVEQGVAQGVEQMAQKLRAAGVDEEAIRAAAEAVLG